MVNKCENLWNFDTVQMLDKNSVIFFFYCANSRVDMNFPGSLFLNFYEVTVYLYYLLNYYLWMFMIFSYLNIFTPLSA